MKRVNDRQATDYLLGGGLPGTPVLYYDARFLNLSDNDPVSSFTDLSGNGRHATQATGADQPTFRTGIMNGHPVVRFDGATDHMDVPNFMTGFTSGEVYAVVSSATTSNQGWWIFGGQANHMPFSGQIYESFGRSTRLNWTPTATYTNPMIYNVRSASGNWGVRINGASETSTVTNTVAFSATPALAINVSGDEWAGDIAAIIIYNTLLSTADRDALTEILAGRYGISI